MATGDVEDQDAPLPEAPLPIVFHIRHFGVGGIESALMGWLHGLDRRRFAPALSIFLPTDEWETVWRSRLPADVPVHLAVPASSSLARRHQARRDNRLGKAGRLWLGLQLRWAQRRHLAPHLNRLQRDYPLIVDFDHTLRKLVSKLRVPVLAVRHFAFWSRQGAKARRVGRDLRAYDRVLVLNDDMRHQAERLYGPPTTGAPHCVVVPNFFDLVAMREKSHASLPPHQTTLAQPPYAVCVARLDIATKGLDTLVAAWQQVIAQEPTARLVIVGGGADQEGLQACIRAQGLEQHVALAGIQVNPYPWIAKARLLVSASRSEGAPNVLVEALALGTPIVATDCPVGPADILQRGRYGLLVRVDDVAALAQALLHGWRDDAWRATASAMGRSRADNYGLAQGNARFGQVVAEVLRDRAHG